jgi:hypothetical protein
MWMYLELKKGDPQQYQKGILHGKTIHINYHAPNESNEND